TGSHERCVNTPNWFIAAVAQDAERVARIALAEDGERDLTSLVSVSPDLPASGRIEVRAPLVMAGQEWAEAVARAGKCRLRWDCRNGDVMPGGRVAGILEGDLDQILRVERPLLNLLQRACGIAGATRIYVEAVSGTGVRILHTRKTAPGLRMLDIAAVLSGGGTLHRVDLARTVMIKDNHWSALRRAGKPLSKAVREARERGAEQVQVEVENPMQLEEACRAGADRLLIDNQSPAILAAWKQRAREIAVGIQIEATGGITLENIRDYAAAGPDFISIGALTHSVVAADLALETENR
ncbi:MAG: carboxylating nicotinate-nucleotide diphosphorylase, partial [Gemmatimonadales bacterium]